MICLASPTTTTQDHQLPRGCTLTAGWSLPRRSSTKKTLCKRAYRPVLRRHFSAEVLSSQMTLTCGNWCKTSHTPPNFISNDTVHFVITVEYRVRLLQSWVLGSELTWLSSWDGSGIAQSLPVYTSTSKRTGLYIHMSYLSSLDMFDKRLLLDHLTATQIERLISSLRWVNSHPHCFLYFILCQVVPAFPSVCPLN